MQADLFASMNLWEPAMMMNVHGTLCSSDTCIYITSHQDFIVANIILYKLLFSRGFYFREFRECQADRENNNTRIYRHLKGEKKSPAHAQRVTVH